MVPGSGRALQAAQARWWRQVTLALLAGCLLLLLALLVLVGRHFFAPFVTRKRAAMLHEQNAKLKDSALELRLSRGSKCLPCLVEWEQRGDTCYHFSNQPQPWGKCVRYCENRGSRLLEMDSEIEMEFIKIQMQRHVEMPNLPLRLSLPHWLGLSYNITRKLWCWLDGTIFPTIRFKNGPRGVNRKNFCGIFLNGQFVHRWCRERHRCICRMKKE